MGSSKAMIVTGQVCAANTHYPQILDFLSYVHRVSL